MRTPAQRGPYGRWLVAAREARGYTTAAEARRALDAAGIRIAHSTYAEYEAGTKVPSKNHLPLLERFWGPSDAYETPGATETPDALVAALTAQTEAIAALVEELRLSRLAQVTATEVAFQALGALGQGQDRAGTRDGNGGADPVGTPR